MNEQKELDKQARTKAYRINLLHLDMITGIIQALIPANEISFEHLEGIDGKKNYNISVKSINGNATELTIYCNDGRRLTITLVYTTGIYTTDGFWDAKERNVEITIRFSNLTNNIICFTRNINYDSLLSLTTDKFVDILEGLSWEYIKNHKDIMFSDEELDIIYDAMYSTPKENLDESLREKSLKLSLNILQETLNRLK